MSQTALRHRWVLGLALAMEVHYLKLATRLYSDF